MKIANVSRKLGFRSIITFELDCIGIGINNKLSVKVIFYKSYLILSL